MCLKSLCNYKRGGAFPSLRIYIYTVYMFFDLVESTYCFGLEPNIFLHIFMIAKTNKLYYSKYNLVLKEKNWGKLLCLKHRCSIFSLVGVKNNGFPFYRSPRMGRKVPARPQLLRLELFHNL